jgi:hypothetical protein
MLRKLGDELGCLLRLALVWPGWLGRGQAPVAGWGHAGVPCRVLVARGAVRAPVTRVFSLYVVQAGSACPA